MNMMKASRYKDLVFISIITLSVLLGIVFSSCDYPGEQVFENSNAAVLFPEYYNLTIPPNIAPLNFIIKEPGSRYRVELSSCNSPSIVVSQRSRKIKIPPGPWKKLLSENKGKDLFVKIQVYRNGTWKKFPAIQHTIAVDSIDSHLMYRLVHAVYLKWRDMGLYQRNLGSFKEEAVIENSSTGYGCINCHSFAGNDPGKMLVHFRILHPGTLIWNDGKLSFVNTKTPSVISAGVYPSWHPGGQFIAFSAGKLSPHLTSRHEKVVDVSDSESDIFIFNSENNQVLDLPALSTGRRENMPVWSNDGKFLYFISAPGVTEGDIESRLHVRYDLMRIAFNQENNEWGEPEMVLNSEETGMSISMPAVSPDGKYIVCSMSDFGYFTIYHKESDLYLVDTETGQYEKLGLNSSSTESHSSWSSNGRWLVFSSKRIDDVFTRPYIAYIDSTGTAHEPFLLPQKDPEVYESLLANYNLPKFITGKVELSPFEIRKMVFEEAVAAEDVE
jgi:hypothetical protein